MKRVLITGGAGFIGSNIAGHIADKGEYRAVVCDIFGKTEKWRNLCKHHISEIIAPMDMFYWLESNADRLKAVIHMGATSSTTETNVDLILENNFSVSKQLWQWCSERDIPFIYASSAATYGEGSAGFDDDLSKDYLNKLVPLNAYGWSKQLFDRFVSSVVEKNEQLPPQWVGLKFFNVYGPNEYHKEDQKSVLSQIYPHASAGLPVRLFKSYRDDYADGAQIRDFIYVKDCVKVIQWFLDHADVSGLFNLGTGEGRSFEDLANAAFSALDKDVAINYIDMPEGVKDKYQYYTKANIKKLRDAGYKDKFTSLEDGVKDYIQNYLSKEDPYY